MQKFSAGLYCEVGAYLTEIRGVLARANASFLGRLMFRTQLVRVVVKALTNEEKLCKIIGCKNSAAMANALIEQVPRMSIVEIIAKMEMFEKLIHVEMESELFLWVPSMRAEAYSNPLSGLEEVAITFPSTRREIEESGKCFAVGRFTASVFHQMRALEPFLAVISRELGVVKHSPTWSAYLSAFSPAIEAKYPGKIMANTEIRNFYSGVTGYLSSIKNAFRNPTMHDIDIVYTEEEARDVRNAVGAFMRHVATKLKE